MRTTSSVRLAAALAVSALVASCGSSVSSPTLAPTIVASAAGTATATPVAATPSPSPTAVPHTTVDNSTLDGKLIMGYQGWFSCPADGTNNDWRHWFNGNDPVASNFRVDMWPDMRELTPAEKCPTSMRYADGSTATVYSSANPVTVDRHFRWMSDYGVDGVFLQMFVTETEDPVRAPQRARVAHLVRKSAEAWGRVFAIEYDVSNDRFDPNLVAAIENDWKSYVADGTTSSPAYLHHHGLPLVGIYGLGQSPHPATPAQAMDLVNFFEKNTDPAYRATLFGGVPAGWRTLTGASLTDPAWANFYCSLNVVSPWTVGGYATDAQVDAYKATIVADMAKAKSCGAEFMPLVWPGTAFHNNGNGTSYAGSNTAFNLIPRRGGRLYWRQVYDAISAGAPAIFNAMFDEIDEDTAMFKVAETKADQPVGVDLLSMDADGEKLPSDWYLRLAGAATKMLRGEIPLTPGLPLNPDGSLVSSFATPEPTRNLAHARIQITTSSDWTTFNLVGGGSWTNPVVVSVSPEASGSNGSGFPLSLNETLARANSGKSVTLIVDVDIVAPAAGQKLTFEIDRGAIGRTTVTLMNYTGNTPVAVKTVTWRGLSGGSNPYRFVVAADAFLPKG
jgi:hypothetical protein